MNGAVLEWARRLFSHVLFLWLGTFAGRRSAMFSAHGVSLFDGRSHESARGGLVSSSKPPGGNVVIGGDGGRFKQLLFDASDAHVVVDVLLHF